MRSEAGSAAPADEAKTAASAASSPRDATIVVRRLERALERSRDRCRRSEELVAELAHDLRAPLASARLALELIGKSGIDSDDMTSRMRRNFDRADGMLRDMLDGFRSLRVDGRLPVHIGEANAASITLQAIEDLALAAIPRRVEITRRGNLDGYWDADLVRRAVWNLVSNALKYGEPDHMVAVALRRRDDRVEIAIHNDGARLSGADRKRMFAPFAQLRPGTALGWGLGLTLVAGCARAHGGVVSVASSASSGTTFTLTLPVDCRDDPAGLG